MKTSLLLLIFLATAFSAHASELKDCQQKIAEMIGVVAPTAMKGPTGKMDSYHVSQDQNCGVEYTEEGYLTVNRVSKPKFETIILNHAELSAKDRVKAYSYCTISENSVFYTTELPIFSDGVKSPYQIKNLTVTKTANQVTVSLVSKLSLLSSPISCTF